MPNLERFISASYLLTGDLMEVPHLGEETIKILEAKGVTSTHQLIGKFMSGNKDKETFIEFLEEAKSPASHRKKLAEAIEKRVFEVGVKTFVKLPDKVDGVPVSSKLDVPKAEAIRARKFNNNLQHDLSAVGLGTEKGKAPNQSALALKNKMGVTTTWQLYGAMLRHFDAVPTTANLIAFFKELDESGMAKGHRTTLVDAMLEKLSVGLDNCAAPRQEAIPDSPSPKKTVSTPSSPPGTGQATRTQSRIAPDERPPPAKPRREQVQPPAPKSTPGLLIPALGVLAVAFFGYRFFVGSRGGQLVVAGGEWV